MSTFIYIGPKPFKHFICTSFGVAVPVSESEFFECVGFDRELVPMRYHKGNINRQDFYIDDVLIAYRIRE